jgi:hypothetical protein
VVRTRRVAIPAHPRRLSFFAESGPHISPAEPCLLLVRHAQCPHRPRCGARTKRSRVDSHRDGADGSSGTHQASSARTRHRGSALFTREAVARFLKKAGEDEVAILGEQANRGRTLIESSRSTPVIPSTPWSWRPATIWAIRENRNRGHALGRTSYLVRLLLRQLDRKHLTVLRLMLRKHLTSTALSTCPSPTSRDAYLLRELRDAGLDFSLDRV